jgi:PPOX class probable F420-dependent enzyme
VIRLAFKVRAEDAMSGGLADLKGSQPALLVTFRRNGKLVPSPVWLAVDSAGRGYLSTENTSGKVKRIRNHPEVLVAASTMRGRPKGPVLKAQARVLPKDEWARAEDTLAAATVSSARCTPPFSGCPKPSRLTWRSHLVSRRAATGTDTHPLGLRRDELVARTGLRGGLYHWIILRFVLRSPWWSSRGTGQSMRL